MGEIKNEIIGLIREERERLRTVTACANLFLNKTGDTGWIFTYITNSDGGQHIIRLGLSHPSIGERQFSLYESGQCCLISPAEATKKQAETLQKEFSAVIEPLPDISDQEKLQASIVRHRGVIAGVIRRLKPQFPSISEFSQIGVHLLSGHRGISPITACNQQNVSLQLTL